MTTHTPKITSALLLAFTLGCDSPTTPGGLGTHLPLPDAAQIDAQQDGGALDAGPEASSAQLDAAPDATVDAQVPDAAATCGGDGQRCCPGQLCSPGFTCPFNQPPFGQCSSFNDNPDQMCCFGNTQCHSGHCQPCGRPGLLCCIDTPTGSAPTCSDGPNTCGSMMGVNWGYWCD